MDRDELMALYGQVSQRAARGSLTNLVTPDKRNSVTRPEADRQRASSAWSTGSRRRSYEIRAAA